MRIICVILIFLSACAHNRYESEMLPDGKTWKVRSSQMTCDRGEQADCEGHVDAGMNRHAKELCGDKEFRVFECQNHEGGWFSEASLEKTCLVQCKN